MRQGNSIQQIETFPTHNGIGKWAYKTAMYTVTPLGVESIGCYGSTPQQSQKEFSDFAKLRGITWMDGSLIEFDADGMVTI